MKFKTIILIALAVLITILTIQNVQEVEVNILFWNLSSPLIAVIFIMLAAGFLVGYLVKSIGKKSQKGQLPQEKDKVLLEKK
jgi:uncharacterized integral membrane protein